MRQLLVAAAIAASMSGCCTVIGGVAGHASGTSRAEELEANNEPVPEHIVADRTFMGMVVGAAVDALLIYKLSHSLDDGRCPPTDNTCTSIIGD